MNIKRTVLVAESQIDELVKSLPREWAIMMVHQAVAESVLGSLDEIPAREFGRTSEFLEDDYHQSANFRFVPVSGHWKRVMPFIKNSTFGQCSINPDFIKPGRIRFAVKPKTGQQWDTASLTLRVPLPKELECDGIKTKPVDLELEFNPDNYDWELAPIK